VVIWFGVGGGSLGTRVLAQFAAGVMGWFDW
jgi:hypothetical protein